MKQFDWQTPRAAFAPPSDMTPGSGGSSTTKKVFVGLGIGCGVLLIIIGILFAAGAFKAVSCCNEFGDVMDSSTMVKDFSADFAQEIWEGKLDEAYARTSSSYQEKITLEQFKAAIEVHRKRIEANQPRLFNMNLENHGEELPSLEAMANGAWLMSYQFAGPQDETMLLLIFRAVPTQTEDGTKGYEVDEVNFDERERSLDHEPPASEVLRVHEIIKRGQYELAFSRFGNEFKQSSDRAAFREFMKSTSVGDALKSTEMLEIKHVDYNEANTQATVMTLAQNSKGENVILQFELTSPPQMPGVGWRIVTIAETIAEANNDSAPTPAATNNTNSQTNQGSTNAAPNSNGAEPPTVDVK